MSKPEFNPAPNTEYFLPPELSDYDIAFSCEDFATSDRMIGNVVQISKAQGIEYSPEDLRRATDAADIMRESCSENEVVIIASQSDNATKDFLTLWEMILRSHNLDPSHDDLLEKPRRYIPIASGEYKPGLVVTKLNILDQFDKVQFAGQAFNNETQSFAFPSVATSDNPVSPVHPMRTKGSTHQPGVEILWFALSNPEYVNAIGPDLTGFPGLWIPGIQYVDTLSRSQSVGLGASAPSSDPLVSPRYLSLGNEIDAEGNSTPYLGTHWRDLGSGSHRLAIPAIMEQITIA